jgi:hypothetical protein
MPKSTEAFWHDVFEFALHSILKPDEQDVLIMHALGVRLESPQATGVTYWLSDADCRRRSLAKPYR